MAYKYTRADLGISNESAPFNIAQATNFRIHQLIMEASMNYVSDDLLRYKKVLDVLFLEAVTINTKVIVDKENTELNNFLEEKKAICDKEEQNYIIKMCNVKGNLIISSFKQILYSFQRALMQCLDKKGILTAKQDTGDSALDEMWEE